MKNTNAKVAGVLIALTLATAPAAAQVTEIIDATGDGMGHPLFAPGPVAVDASGNVFVGAVTNMSGFFGLVFKVAPDGEVTLLMGPSGDGMGHNLSQPWDLEVDGDGNLFVSSPNSGSLFKVSPSGVITEILDDDLGYPSFLCVDDLGNLYATVSFLLFRTVVKITPTGEVSVVLDAAEVAPDETWEIFWDVAVDPAGNIYVAGNGTDSSSAPIVFVYRLSPSGEATKLIDGSGDGAGNILEIPIALAVGDDQTLYVASAGVDGNCFAISAEGSITKILGPSGDEAGNPLSVAGDIALDGAGNLYVTGYISDNVFVIRPDGSVVEVLDASWNLDGPFWLALDSSENVYISGVQSANVLKLEPSPTGGTCGFRNGSGTNPSAFFCATAPDLGTDWEVWVDPLPTEGIATIGTGVVFGLGGPSPGSFYKGYEILIAGPPIAVSSATGMHSFPVPASASFLGVPFSTQGVRLEDTGSDLVWVLLNAVDIVIGI